MKKIFGNLVSGIALVAVLMLGVAFLATAPAQTAYAGDVDCTADVSGEPLTNAIGCAKPDGAPTDLFGDGGIFTTVANILIFIVGIIAVIMLIIGGIRYAVSGGDQTAVTNAKNTILYAIVGLVVAFVAFAVVNFVVTQLQENTDAGYIRLLLK